MHVRLCQNEYRDKSIQAPHCYHERAFGDRDHTKWDFAVAADAGALEFSAIDIDRLENGNDPSNPITIDTGAATQTS